jgi:two-component system sensor histidine kinase RpfC
MVIDGQEALDALKVEKFDVLLLDVNMPRLDGIEMCRIWRKLENGQAKMPIIGVTADATDETKNNCIDAGMNFRVTKPVNAKAILKLIDEVCGGETDLPLPANNLDVPSRASQYNALYKNKKNQSIDHDQIAYLQSIGGADFVQGMISGFFEDVAETEPQFKSAIEHNDVSQFRFFAHAFKSSANNIGATKLSKICGEFEAASDADFRANRLAFLDKIETELKRVRAELTDFRNAA